MKEMEGVKTINTECMAASWVTISEWCSFRLAKRPRQSCFLVFFSDLPYGVIYNGMYLSRSVKPPCLLPSTLQAMPF